MDEKARKLKLVSRIPRGSLFVACVLASPFLFWFAYPHIFPLLANFGTFRDIDIDGKVTYTHEATRQIAFSMFTAEKMGKQFPGEPYWGPLSPPLLAELQKEDPYAVPTNELIDPFNHDGPRSEWRETSRMEMAPIVRLRGLDLQLYSDGAKFFMIIGRGPDKDLDLTPEILESIKEFPLPVNSPDLINRTYDVTNGVISSGDIWRDKR